MQVTVRCNGRKAAYLEATRTVEHASGCHRYAWLVEHDGEVHRGTVMHWERLGVLVLVWRLLYTFLSSPSRRNPEMMRRERGENV
jgi:hypothetical protein